MYKLEKELCGKRPSNETLKKLGEHIIKKYNIYVANKRLVLDHPIYQNKNNNLTQVSFYSLKEWVERDFNCKINKSDLVKALGNIRDYGNSYNSMKTVKKDIQGE